jgi:hypothetical protein
MSGTGQLPPRGLLGWAADAPAVAAPEDGAESGLPDAQVRSRRRSRKWIYAGVGACLLVAVPAVAIPVALSGPSLTPVGATVRSQHTSEFWSRSADITVNSLQVADDDSLCTSSGTDPTHGFWLVVDLTVTNTSNEAFPMNNGGFSVFDEDGADVDPDFEPNDCVADSSTMIGEDVRPGATERIRLAFDVSAASGVLTYEPVVADRAISWAFPG